MADPAIVADALLVAAQQLSVGTPPMKFSLPDIRFVPESDANGSVVPYFEVMLFFNAPKWEGVTDGQVDQGLLQITVVVPARAGIIKPLNAASAVRAAFPKGRKIGPATVDRAPWQATPIYEASQTRVPVTISWSA